MVLVEIWFLLDQQGFEVTSNKVSLLGNHVFDITKPYGKVKVIRDKKVLKHIYFIILIKKVQIYLLFILLICLANLHLKYTSFNDFQNLYSRMS